MAVGYWARREDVIVGRPFMNGILAVPDKARGIVIFADGGKSGAHEPRNVKVAAALHARRFATLMLELLSDDDNRDHRSMLDTDFLCRHVVEAISWAAADPRTATLPVSGRLRIRRRCSAVCGGAASRTRLDRRLA
jgi:hypothetical protein